MDKDGDWDMNMDGDRDMDRDGDGDVDIDGDGDMDKDGDGDVPLLKIVTHFYIWTKFNMVECWKKTQTIC